MTPARLIECLDALHWSTETLAEVFGCDEALTEAWVLGLEEVPMKASAWIEVLAQFHEAAEAEKPKGLKGKKATWAG